VDSLWGVRGAGLYNPHCLPSPIGVVESTAGSRPILGRLTDNVLMLTVKFSICTVVMFSIHGLQLGFRVRCRVCIPFRV